MPDSLDGLSGFPENMPATVGRLPCLRNDTPANAVGFVLLAGNAPGDDGAFFARGNREGNMGVGEGLWVVQPELEGKVLVPTTNYGFWPAKFAKIFKKCRDSPTNPSWSSD